MTRLLFFFVCFSSLGVAVPKCHIKKNSSHQKVSTVSGIATGFQNGKIYVTLSNGNRKYTTVAERDGHWALSFADLEKKSEVVCWQEGNGLTAQNSTSQN
jgi:hypothetical protein